MSIKLFNTLNGRKEDFLPIEPGKVGMYVCGVTVYDMCHIGHARAYITADLIYRYFQYRGFEVTYVRNFTDVDDKIIRRANELGVSTEELSSRFIQEFYCDMDALGIHRPNVEPRVTKHIPEIIRMVETLIRRGHAYVVDSDVYFDVPSFSMYGRLSGRNLEDLKAGARVEVDERKRYPWDFALWKGSKPGEPAWDSPWGKGRPGWHIECSTMSMKYLGETFDIHGGGKDLVFPHHENEIAQSEAATGKTFCRYFFHNGFVNIDKEKMSKSLNNFFTIREICERYEPEALKYFILTTHYRSPINFDVLFSCPSCQKPIARTDIESRRCPVCGNSMNEAQAAQAIRFPSLEESHRRLQYLYSTLQRLDEAVGMGVTGAGEMLRREEIDNLLPRFEEAMDDDFNTASALAVLGETLKIANDVLDNKQAHSAALVTSTSHRLREIVGKMSAVLGVLERNPKMVLQKFSDKATTAKGVDAANVDRLVADRTAARKAKDFKKADSIRQKLDTLGIELMDSAQGTRWKVKE
jgi:cysteinyl-tRNA synthetase